MKPVEFAELLSQQEYATQRERIRHSMIARRARRRLHVGEHMTLHFENRDTVYYQVQEMLRAEHITERKAIEHELETYNELLPARDSLTATLMLEYSSPHERATELAKLLDLDQHLWLVVGSLPPGRAEFDRRQIDTDRISAVQFIRFHLTESQVATLTSQQPPPVSVRVDHPHYQAEVYLTGELLDELQDDLQSD